MKNFRSLDEIREASEEQLAEIPGMNRKAAESVYRFFHNNK